MDIVNPTPITIPEKEYAQMFVTNISIVASPTKPWNVSIIGVPYDGVDGLLESQKTVVHMQDIRSLAALDPELAQATGVMLSVIAKYLVKAKQKDIKIVTAQNIEQVLE